MTDLSNLLDRTLLFSGLHASHKQQIASVMELHRFAAGQVVFGQGDPGDALFVIESGEVVVSVTSQEMGIDLELARLGPGQVFGEMALITGDPRSATVKAASETSCHVLSRQVFVKILNQLPEVTMEVARTVARRLDQVNREQGISFASLASLRVDAQAYSMVPAPILQKHRMIPLCMDGGTLTMAMVDPSDVVGFDDVRRCLHGVNVKPIAISEEDYEGYVNRHIRPSIVASGTGPIQAAGSQWRDLKLYSAAEDAEEDRKASTGVSGAEIVALVNQILAEAIDREASDIHVDCERLVVHVRFRVDGQLVEREKSVPRSHYRPLVSRIKILAGMDISEQRLPQDGRISLCYRKRDFDIRVATMPVRGGERIAMRLLDASSSVLELGNLILAEKLAQLVRKMVFRPSGAVLVTGPTGSGKTTTLYSLLRERTRYAQDLNVVTVEDPVEYDLPGMAQVQVNESAGLTFPVVLRGFLRHDPDIIMVGETRDGTTARIAMEASLTGHLVLTSMHTTSAIGSVVRLREMGIEPYLIASALSGVVAQRLVRRLCPMCRQKVPYLDSVADNLVRAGVLAKGESFETYKEGGCENCDQTGFRGRVGVYEVLQLNDTMRSLIATEQPMDQLARAAEGGGMVTMRRYAGFLLRHGLTVPSEVLRVLSADG